MSIPFLSNIDLNQNELQNVRIQNLASDPGSPVEGQIWHNTTSHKLMLYDGTGNRVLAELNNTLDQFGAPAADVAFNSKKITGLAEPTSAGDAATKGYVDSVALGLDVKASVRVATTAPIDLSTALVNGVTIDGITVATGDRVLVKSQSTTAQNGIYIVAAAGAAARAADCNSSSNYVSGAFCFVEQGTAYAGTSWVVSTQGTLTVGSTSVTWTQFAGGATYSGSGAIDLSGTTFSLKTDGVTLYVDGSSNAAIKSSSTAKQVIVSQGSGSAAWGKVDLSSANAVENALPLTLGGTGATSAADARTALAATTKYAASVGNGSATTITVTHNLGTTDVVVFTYANGTGKRHIQVETQITDSNTVTLVFSAAPTTGAYRVVVVG